MINIDTYRTYNHEHSYLYKEILELTNSIGETYPEHSKWFWDKFLVGLKTGGRGYIIAEQNNNLAGVVLFKDTEEEKKISTLFVNPEYRKQGIATRLLQEAKKELGAGCILTVSARNMFQLKPLLVKSGFKVFDTKRGEYKPDNIEYYFRYEPSKVPANICEWARLNGRRR